jgi:hypothetical protein
MSFPIPAFILQCTLELRTINGPKPDLITSGKPPFTAITSSIRSKKRNYNFKILNHPFPDFLAMKLLVLFLVSGLATAMPRKGNKPNGPKQEKGIITYISMSKPYFLVLKRIQAPSFAAWRKTGKMVKI